MKRNELIRINENVYRILSISELKVLVINCHKATMPIWADINDFQSYETISEDDLLITLNTTLPSYDNLSNKQKKLVQEKYNLVAPIINCVDIPYERNEMIQRIAERKGISKQTIRKYLCKYLVFQDICCFFKPKKEKVLSLDEKHFTYILNKHFYTSQKKSLHTTYLYLLREFYTDSSGNLIDKYPKFYQFKYYYYKTRKLSNYYISRLGKSSYERDHNVLLGDSHSYFNSVGYCMVDSTIADIWLIDDNGNLLGRPIISAAICPFSEFLLGYVIGFQENTDFIKDLIIDINTRLNLLPMVIISDQGKPYVSQCFANINDIGVELVALKPYAPNSKGLIEQFFNIIQNQYYKQYLQTKGVINSDFAIRGTPNYQKQATLTIEEFKQIISMAVKHFNEGRLIKNIPYNCVGKCKPFAKDIFYYSLSLSPNAFIKVSNEELEKIMLPRTNGKFTRKGLIVNGLRYRALGYVDSFLKGGKAMVAYNPFNVSYVFLIDEGNYVKFDLIERFFDNKTIEEVQSIKKQKKEIINQYKEEALQSEMNMGAAIDSFIQNKPTTIVNTKNVKEHRNNEIKKERLKKGIK